jgi:hypothetical protein
VTLTIDGASIALMDAETKAVRDALYSALRLELAVSQMGEATAYQRARARVRANRLRGLARIFAGSLTPSEFPEFRRAENYDFAPSTPTAVETE